MSVLTEEAQQINRELEVYLKQGRSCLLCSHLAVCALYRAIRPLLAEFKSEVKPFHVHDLALICKQYMPITLKLNK